MMAINVLVFGMIKDVVGSNTIVLNDISDTDELTQQLHAMFPSLALSKYSIAVNKNIIHSNTPLLQETEVAILPPFSGG